MNKFITGADECGTGSAILNIVVCAVTAPTNWNLEGLDDSKKIKVKSEKQLYIIADKLKDLASRNEIKFHISERSNIFVDANGLSFSLKECYYEALNSSYVEDSHIIIDGNLKFDSSKIKSTYECMIKADTKIPAVMAASILAKTYRDTEVRKYHDQYPEYNWKNNIGYLSKEHLLAIKKYGLTPYHRKSYKIPT